MFQPTSSSARAFTASPDTLSTLLAKTTPVTLAPVTPATPDPAPSHETVRHLVLGSLAAVRMTILLLHKHRYAEPNDWSKPIPTGQPNEVMVILTKKVQVS